MDKNALLPSGINLFIIKSSATSSSSLDILCGIKTFPKELHPSIYRNKKVNVNGAHLKRRNFINRFFVSLNISSLFLFEPWSKTRRVCVYIATNQFFDYFVIATIVLNCVFLAMTETVEEAE